MPTRLGPKDHPRSRGEYFRCHLVVNSQPGSSPLSRGIPWSGAPVFGSVRIIPALAGNTRTLYAARVHRSDHPRSRGEYDSSPRSSARPEGSSPLSRGIRSGLSRLSMETRIIPALAGNTRRLTTRISMMRDHPRSRGEYPSVSLRRHQESGSSPLSRGIQHPSDYSPTRIRIIPALAGNTTVSDLQYTAAQDHPRSRGEYSSGGCCRTHHLGSSPLSRGIQVDRLSFCPIRRIIPALAGNTSRKT